MSYLPGDKPFKQRLHSMLRVDHAGEMGACQIYRGQQTAATIRSYPSATKAEIITMLDQEQQHYTYFSQQIIQHRSRPSFLAPAWKAGGRLMGLLSGLLGPDKAMNCTVAVESVIDQHYRDQLHQLDIILTSEIAPISPTDRTYLQQLKTKLEQFRLEEVEHLATAVKHNNSYPAAKNDSKLVRIISIAAIWVAKRL